MHKQAARTLRRNQTDAEQQLWRYLRNRRLAGYKFRRQVPIKPYIVDFLSPPLDLIIELDGSQHLDQTEYDQARTKFLETRGLKVIRFWNDEVLTQTESVLDAILLALTQQEARLMKALSSTRQRRSNS